MFTESSPCKSAFAGQAGSGSDPYNVPMTEPVRLAHRVAELAGCSTRFVHTVEAGKDTLRLDKLIELLAALGLGLALRRGPPGIAAEAPEGGEPTP